MTILVPFEGNFCGKDTTIYSVDNDKPLNAPSSVTTLEVCPNPKCGQKHVYRVYDHVDEREEENSVIEIFDSKCPSCDREFQIEIEIEL